MSEDDSEDRLDQNPHDPERLKAFNVSLTFLMKKEKQNLILLAFSQMFVRLFVDENLDRMIPISKQPKEKIQAIIDSCTRQFPEFAERSRKRIRTYLKSCRRNKKAREGWENTVSISIFFFTFFHNNFFMFVFVSLKSKFFFAFFSLVPHQHI